MSQKLQHEAIQLDFNQSRANDPAGDTAAEKTHADNSMTNSTSSDDVDNDDKKDNAPIGGNSGKTKVTVAAPFLPAEMSKTPHTTLDVLDGKLVCRNAAETYNVGRSRAS